MGKLHEVPSEDERREMEEMHRDVSGDLRDKAKISAPFDQAKVDKEAENMDWEEFRRRNDALRKQYETIDRHLDGEDV